MSRFNASSSQSTILCDDSSKLHAVLDDLNPGSDSISGTNSEEIDFDRLKGRAHRLHSVLQEREVVNGATVEWYSEADVGRWAVGILEGLVRVGFGLGDGEENGAGLGVGNAVKGVRGLRERVERSEAELERREREVEKLKEKVRRKDGRVWELEKKVREFQEQEHDRRRKGSKDSSALRLKISKMEKREKVLFSEKQRASREVVALKKKLQDVMRKGGRRPGIRVTGRRKWEEEEMENDSGDGADFYEMVHAGYEESRRELLAENDDFRNLLRSAHEELDDIVVQCHSLNVLPDNQELPEQALDSTRMQLPYEMIREEFETLFEAKINTLRKFIVQVSAAKHMPKTPEEKNNKDGDDEKENTGVQSTPKHSLRKGSGKATPLSATRKSQEAKTSNDTCDLEIEALQEKFEQFGPQGKPGKQLEL